MDRRTVLALILVAIVVLITPRIFSTRVPASEVVAPARDSLAQPPRVPDSAGAVPSAPVAAPAGTQAPSASVTPMVETPAESSVIRGTLSDFQFSSAGASLERVVLKSHRSLSSDSGAVELSDPSGPLLHFRLLVGRDTVPLNQTAFAREVTTDSLYVGYVATARNLPVRISYTAVPDSYLVRVSGTVAPDSAGRRAEYLLIDLPSTLRSFEADTLADQGSLSYAIKPARRSAEGIAFRSLDPGERRLVPGPISWAVAKSKYFLLGVMMAEGDESVAEVQAVGGTRSSSVPTRAQAMMVRPLTSDGSFAFEVYAGPQEYQRLRAMGRDFENSNPYGGFMQAVVQPFATIVMKVLLWMKAALPLSYGWLLIVFGVVVRLLLWPLNQGAMRTSMKMQRIQPELAALQAKYKSDPQKLQGEMMRVYKEHDMSPFSAFAGCLPLLLPMPILFALFFVFQNTIEFRGVPFLWLSDISLKDPFYIVPVLMGLSMFVMSWVGMRNSPPNQQAKIMGYVLPVMMTVMFANFASGLNLYYAVQNVAAIPQQWLIANERAKSAKKT
jgi:YidC/Oxa1 family membrane protein insertase